MAKHSKFKLDNLRGRFSPLFYLFRIAKYSGGDVVSKDSGQKPEKKKVGMPRKDYFKKINEKKAKSGHREVFIDTEYGNQGDIL
jgi:hypothetical protein